MYQRIGIIGSSGAIGQALTKHCIEHHSNAHIHTFSRHENSANNNVAHHKIDYKNEDTIAKAAKDAAQEGPFDLVIIATGILHDDANDISPEKSLRDLSMHKFEQVFAANTIFPALVLKHFIPLLNKDNRSVIAALSARVGSISDNHIGGWYAYRASKTALNMIIKNAAIEVARRHKQTIILGLHPGTVDSPLSKPFQSNVHHEIFSPERAAHHLMDVIGKATAEDSGKSFAWDGEEIVP